MAVSRLSLKSLNAALDSSISQIQNDCSTAVTELIGTSSTSGFSQYQTINSLYALAVNSSNSQLDTLISNLTNTVIGDLSSLPTGLQTFNAMAEAVINDIDGVLNLTGVSEDFDTLTKIVTYMVQHNNAFHEYLTTALETKRVRCGTGTFTEAGTNVTFTTAMEDSSYGVFISISSRSSGNIGEYYVSNITSTGFTVNCTGEPEGETFDFLAISNS